MESAGHIGQFRVRFHALAVGGLLDGRDRPSAEIGLIKSVA
jgi:hypothetical protein